MKIDIHPDSKVQDLKKQFHGYFPYLKLEFFKNSHKESAGSHKAGMLENSTVLSGMMADRKEGTVEFTAATSVRQFEQLFDVSFGLYVQIFRKSGRLYLETTATDDWTLGQQNAEGKDSVSDNMDEAPRDLTDRDQWE